MTEPRRVALLARPGAAMDRMRGALGDAGARIVLEADPTRIEPAVLSDASADVVLVVLDPAIEESIDRFEGVLADPSIEVIFEEAELALAREGWDAARWVRHLAAKLHRHGDVLPPRRDADWTPEFTGVLDDDEPAPAPVAIELADDDIALGGIGLDDLRLDDKLDDIRLDAMDDTGLDISALDADKLDDSGLGDIRFDGLALDDIVVDEIVMEESGDGPGLQVVEIEQSLPSYDDAVLSAPGSALEDLTFTVPSFDNPPPPALDSLGERDRFRRDLDDLSARIASMELVDDRPAQAKPATTVVTGAVLVMAGIGGPDAVRQLLGALPGNFARPVLVQQRLDGGRYDRLVTQMQRATSLPVKLAEPGMRACSGEIYILPGEVGVASDSEGLVFNDRPAELLSSLPTAESAVLLLSGTDAAVVDAVMNQSWAGALVAGQSPEGCYDAAATNALIARGGTAGQPVELARRLAERWPS